MPHTCNAEFFTDFHNDTRRKSGEDAQTLPLLSALKCLPNRPALQMHLPYFYY